MIRKKSVAIVGVIAGGLLVGTAATAMAVGQGRTYTYTLQDTGFSFPGSSTFYADTVNHGGMDYVGTLRDTNSGDGNQVFVNAKVEGLGWGSRTYTGSSVYINRYQYVTSQTYVRNGQVQACRDRGTFGNDNCRQTVTMYR